MRDAYACERRELKIGKFAKRTDDKIEQLADLSLEAKALGGHFVREGRERVCGV